MVHGNKFMPQLYSKTDIHEDNGMTPAYTVAIKWTKNLEMRRGICQRLCG